MHTVGGGLLEGQGDAWWKKQLKEATENYESTSRKMNERLEDQSGKLLSPTQWNMNRVGNRQLVEERAKYEAR